MPAAWQRPDNRVKLLLSVYCIPEILSHGIHIMWERNPYLRKIRVVNRTIANTCWTSFDFILKIRHNHSHRFTGWCLKQNLMRKTFTASNSSISWVRIGSSMSLAVNALTNSIKFFNIIQLFLSYMILYIKNIRIFECFVCCAYIIHDKFI